MRNLKLCIDAGHGSWTPGKRTAPFTKDIDIDSDGKIEIKKGQQYREHFANVMVASFLDDILRKYGIGIIKTGWDDEDGYDDFDASIEIRQSVIRKAACEYVISIHYNASCSNLKQLDNANGVSVYVRTEKEKRGDSDKLAKALLMN